MVIILNFANQTGLQAQTINKKDAVVVGSVVVAAGVIALLNKPPKPKPTKEMDVVEFDHELTKVSNELAERIHAKGKTQVVILHIVNENDQYTSASVYIMDMIADALVNGDKSFEVFDRENVEDLAISNKLIREGYINKQEVAELSKLTNVEVAISGTYMIVNDYIKLNLKVVNVVTGFLVATLNKKLPLTADSQALIVGESVNSISKNSNNLKTSDPRYPTSKSFDPNCETRGTGDICFTNNSSEMYHVSIMYEYNAYGASGYKEISLKIGESKCFYSLDSRNWYYEVHKGAGRQYSNYKTDNLFVEKCKSTNVVFD